MEKVYLKNINMALLDEKGFFLNQMYHTNNTTVYLDGKWIPADQATTSLYDQTLHYGNGVFEGIRAYEKDGLPQIFKAEEHFERLLFSANAMHIDLNVGVEEMVTIAKELLAINNLLDAYIRPLVYLGPNMKLEPVKEVHFFMCAWEWGSYLGNQLIRVMTSSYQRPNPKSCHVEAKTVGHYTNSILATTEANSKGFDEALLTDMNGFVAEGSGANFFFEKDGKLYTPALGNILSGITRKTIIELAREVGYEVEEGHFTVNDVKQADSAFFTGTAAEVAGIASLDNYVFPLAWEDSIGSELARMYQKRVKAQNYQKFELV